MIFKIKVNVQVLNDIYYLCFMLCDMLLNINYLKISFIFKT